ncbi:hypothetical protein Tco_1101375, partial [Tanacetum coccineum]
MLFKGDTENTGSDVDGKENVCDGDGIENGGGIGEVIVKFYDRIVRELIDSEDRLILEILIDDVPRVAAQRAPRGTYNPPGYAQPSTTSTTSSICSSHHISSMMIRRMSLVPQGQKASDYDNSDPVPSRQNVVPSAEKTDSS